MPRKQAKDVNELSAEDLDAILKEEVPANEAFMNLVYALGVAAMPIYLYLSPMFGLTLEEHAVHMAVVTVVTAVLLSMAYGKVAQKEVIRLSKKADSRPAKKGSKGSDDAAAAAIVKQASSYSYFRNNALFLVMFVIVAFNIVPAGVPNFINYAVSVVGPAVVVNLLS